jgi:hypothetical protein
MKIGDRFIDFDSALEMEITDVQEDFIWARPSAINFEALTIPMNELYDTQEMYSRTYTDLEYVESAIRQFNDDCMK